MNKENSTRQHLRALYRGVPLSYFDRCFVRAREWMLPLEVLDKVIAPEGKIVEIGCGHGLICNYLGLAKPNRAIIGVDIDPRRMVLANATLRGRKNVVFQEGRFENFNFTNLDMVILFGVLCLTPLKYWDELFMHIHRALKPGGELLLHDIRADNSLTFRFHTFKETCFRVVGITKGEVVTVMSEEALEKKVRQYGFDVQKLGPELGVPFHSCFTWLLKKQ